MGKEMRIFGPPGCLSGDTLLPFKRGKRNSGRFSTIKEAYYKFNNIPVTEPYWRSWDKKYDTFTLSLKDDIIGYHIIRSIFYSGVKTIYKVTVGSGKSIEVSIDHPFKTETDFVSLNKLSIGDYVMCRGHNLKFENTNKTKRTVTYSIRHHPYAFKHIIDGKNYKRNHTARLIIEAKMNNLLLNEFIDILRTDAYKSSWLRFLPKNISIHHKNNDQSDDDYNNLQVCLGGETEHQLMHVDNTRFGNVTAIKEKIISIRKLYKQDTYDIIMEDPYHNYLANDFIVHNTGKTTKLATEIVPMLADKYGASKVMLTSFTRAAAVELGQRIDTADSSNIGTLHSMCYKALKHPPLTEERLNDWNRTMSKYSLMKEMLVGPPLYAAYQIYRNKMIKRDRWRKDVSNFAKEWEKWKNKNHLMDFMDLIEAASNFLTPPGSPSVIVIDEAQDFTKLEMSTLRRWATQCQEFWVVGDEDQGIYSFSGASPENMLLPELPPEQKIILDQSYRIPNSVHGLAENLIKRVIVREPKEYKPRGSEGSIKAGHGAFNDPAWIVGEVIRRADTSMIIASCNYMLEDVADELRNRGIPFSNPWRKEAKNWNPLETNGAKLLLSFLNSGEDEEYWSTSQFITWAEELRVGKDGLIRGQGRAGIKQLKEMVEENPDTPGLHTCREYIDDILSPGVSEIALKRDAVWLKANVVKKTKRLLQFPTRVLSKQGIEALSKEPTIYIGTIHSFKGSEAHNVFLYPDISGSSMREMEQPDGYDNLCRLFYVGITRTKENLILMPPATDNYFEI